MATPQPLAAGRGFSKIENCRSRKRGDRAVVYAVPDPSAGSLFADPTT
jgi:hypothetical protein